MQSNMHETDDFLAAKKVVRRESSIKALMKYPREILVVVGLTMGGTTAFYTYTTYMQKFLKLSVGLNDIQTTMVTGGSLIFALFLQPVYGALSDRIGRKPLLIWFGCLADCSWLHLDQCRGEGRVVPHQRSRHRRRTALRNHRFHFWRDCGIDRAVVQVDRSRDLVLFLSDGSDRHLTRRLCNDARYSALLRYGTARVRVVSFEPSKWRLFVA